jgi:ubiquinone/menaquinone biosynthesis C-methylase UbiE
MNRTRFSTLAHRDHTFANPVTGTKIDRVLSLLDLEPGHRVLDVGCGNAEVLIRLIERYGVEGVGVDPNGEMLKTGRERAVGRVPPARLQLHELLITEFPVEPETYDAALCIGATHAYNGYVNTLIELKSVVRPGGRILVGEGYWKCSPAPGYLKLLDTSLEELSTHVENVERAVELGLTPLYSVTSSEDEWDHYEGLYRRAIELHVAAHPKDPDAEEFLAISRRWYEGYLRWGRDTLGFALYLFRVEGG